jgi:hypothetical protein
MVQFFKRGAFALAAGLAFAVATTGATSADIGPVQSNQVTLSCNDGHSVVMSVDSATLTSLVADVAAINNSGTGTSCSLNSSTAAGPSTTDAKWTVYDYNASGQEIAPRNSPGSGPATTTGDTTTFPFLDGHFTALLTTTDKSLTGDLSAKTLTDNISVSGDAATFVTQHGGGDCVGDTPAAVRFYFISPSASGSSVGTPPAGFYTRFWWSNPVNLPLTTGDQNGPPISAAVGDPSEWSDWNGQRGDSSPAVLEAFEEAIHKVQTVGLSFGGECFFETGVQAVGTPETFSSTFSEN